ECGPTAARASVESRRESDNRSYMANIFDLSGKVAVVIGGASGIGEAVTLGAAQAGARAMCFDIRGDAAAEVAKRAVAGGCQCEAGVLDIRDSAAVEKAFQDVKARFGSLDIVICTP